ncbi:hypothetical protein T552_01810 [Pneumocystis carinii B80]|uniref:Uncharacterized protein n=1 Tax=Pneumocystis carinii (strain B80) TaxID=1408658 RepID=A0A0W4ZJJ9_PNEC8|nr:hypothetical protein T552_01810 [Pneumocystis carinii B80]KTW28550.1 hypothetical protein T552_01810 [Pneumocystis carinii B80]
MFRRRIMRFLKKKYIQYEVTFALNMLTTTEKIIVNFVFISITALVLMSVYVYFPEHLRQLAAKATYYWYG